MFSVFRKKTLFFCYVNFLFINSSAIFSSVKQTLPEARKVLFKQAQDISGSDLQFLEIETSNDPKAKKLLTALAQTTIERKKTLGHGSFGQVFLAVLPPEDPTSESKKQIFALKKLHKSTNLLLPMSLQLANEIAIFHTLGTHPNIITYHGSFFKESSWFMVLEKGRKSIVDIICKGNTPKKISKAKAQKIKKDLLAGLKFMHQSKVSHRDLKPDNAVAVGSGVEVCYKWIDFSSAFFSGSHENPMMVNNGFYDSNEVAIYLFLKELFNKNEMAKLDFELLDQIFAESRVLRQNFSTISDFLKHLRLQLTAVNPEFTKESYQTENIFKKEAWKKILVSYLGAYDPRMSDIHALAYIFNQFDHCSGQADVERSDITRKLINPNPLLRPTIEGVEEFFSQGIL